MIDLSGYLLYKFPNGTLKGNQWETDCPIPYCSATKSRFFINVDSGAFQCKYCDTKGRSFFSLIMACEQLDLDQTKHWISEHRLELLHSGDIKSTVKTPMQLKLPPCTHLVTTDFITSGYNQYVYYLLNRGFTIEDLVVSKIRNDIRICETGKYAGRLIFPCYEDYTLVYFVDRLIKDGVPNKTIGIGTSQAKWPIDKSTVVWNIDNVQHNKPVYITEGIISAMSLVSGRHPVDLLGESTPVALLGKTASQIQIRKILNKKPSKIIVCLDGGALKYTYMLAAELYSWAMDTEIFIMRLNDKEDPNDVLKRRGTFPTPELFNRVMAI